MKMWLAPIAMADFRTRRVNAGWSLKDLAKLADISQYMLKSIESGTRRGPRAVQAVEKALEHAEKTAPPRLPRGFSKMDKNKQHKIAQAAGRMAHKLGRAHEFTSAEARAAGRKGGATVSQDREHMAALGRKGGKRRWGK
jgi:transcriptional regulator with XRE-family HTH domain